MSVHCDVCNEKIGTGTTGLDTETTIEVKPIFEKLGLPMSVSIVVSVQLEDKGLHMCSRCSSHVAVKGIKSLFPSTDWTIANWSNDETLPLIEKAKV